MELHEYVSVKVNDWHGLQTTSSVRCTSQPPRTEQQAVKYSKEKKQQIIVRSSVSYTWDIMHHHTRLNQRPFAVLNVQF